MTSYNITMDESFLKSNDYIVEYMKIVEGFIADSNLVLGEESIDNIVEHKLMTRYNVYSTDPRQDSRNLAILLYDTAEEKYRHYVLASSALANREYNVFMGPHLLITFKMLRVIGRLKIYDTLQTTDYIMPFTAKKATGLSKDIYLMFVYEKLMSPGSMDAWTALSEKEHKLNTETSTQLPQILKWIRHKNDNKLATFLKNSDYILVGTAAVSILTARPLYSSKIQLLSAAFNPSEIIKLLGLSDASYVIQNPNIPLYSKLRRCKIQVNGRTVIELFNLLEYMAIPFFDVAGVKVATSFTIKWIHHVDIWILRLVGSLTGLSNDKRIKNIKDEFIYLSQHVRKPLFAKKLIGTYIDAIIELKRLVTFYYPPFYPFIHASRTEKG